MRVLDACAGLMILAQASLPIGMASTDRSIATMRIGEEGWTVPWAMYHDKDRKLWLNGSYELHGHPGGTVEMLVRRDDGGWHVDVTHVSFDYTWGEGIYSNEFVPIAVATLNR